MAGKAQNQYLCNRVSEERRCGSSHGDKYWRLLHGIGYPPRLSNRPVTNSSNFYH